MSEFDTRSPGQMVADSLRKAKESGYAGYGSLPKIEPIDASKYPCYICGNPSNGSIGFFGKGYGEWCCRHCYDNVLNMRPPGRDNPLDINLEPFTPDKSGYYFLDDGEWHGLVFVEMKNRVVFFNNTCEIHSRPLDEVLNCFYGSRYDNLPHALPPVNSWGATRLSELVH